MKFWMQYTVQLACDMYLFDSAGLFFYKVLTDEYLKN